MNDDDDGDDDDDDGDSYFFLHTIWKQRMKNPVRTNKKKQKRRRTRVTFPQILSFFLSFFSSHDVLFLVVHTYVPDEYATHNYQTRRPTAQRTESSTKREKRERGRETKRSTTAEGEKGKRWRTTTNGCLREDVNLETTQ